MAPTTAVVTNGLLAVFGKAATCPAGAAAPASANILNMTTSTFSLSDWFGILFINVFRTWNGSFGINTASGEVALLNGTPPQNSGSEAAKTQSFRFGFVPNQMTENEASVKPASLFPLVQTNDFNQPQSDVMLAGAELPVETSAEGMANELLSSTYSQTTSSHNPFVNLAAGAIISAFGLAIEIFRRRRSLTFA